MVKMWDGWWDGLWELMGPILSVIFVLGVGWITWQVCEYRSSHSLVSDLRAALPAVLVVTGPAPTATPCHCASDDAPDPLPYFVLGVATLRVAATRSRIVADDRVHSLKALLKGTDWSRHLRIRPAAGHSGVKYAVDVTQVDGDVGTVFCKWLTERQHWKPGPYPCEVAY